MERSVHSIASPVGVDVSLPVAGPGSRSYAFLIDWHIRLLLALAWFGAAALVVAGTLRLGAVPQQTGVRVGLFAALPAAAIYFLYHPVLEVLMRGRTPGKRMAGLRIVTRDGGTPGTFSLLVRNLFRLVDALPLAYLVGLLSTLITRDHVTVGDLAAGTLLVHDRADALSALDAVPQLARGTRSADPATLDLGLQLLGRWSELAPARRAALAREVLRRLGAEHSAPAAEGGGGTASPTDEAVRRHLQQVLRSAQGLA